MVKKILSKNLEISFTDLSFDPDIFSDRASGRHVEFDINILRYLISKREFEVLRFILQGYKLIECRNMVFYDFKTGRKKFLTPSTVYNLYYRAVYKIRKFFEDDQMKSNVSVEKKVKNELEAIKSHFFLIARKIENEEKSKSRTTGTCEMCRADVEKETLIGRFKLFPFSVKFAPATVKLVEHLVCDPAGISQRVWFCQKCHVYYHCFSLLSEDAIDEWSVYRDRGIPI